MVYYSENQGAKYATKAIMPKSASLTQNMNIMHLKTKVSDSTHSTQAHSGPIEKCTIRIHSAELTEERLVLLGHRLCLDKGEGGGVLVPFLLSCVVCLGQQHPARLLRAGMPYTHGCRAHWVSDVQPVFPHRWQGHLNPPDQTQGWLAPSALSSQHSPFIRHRSPPICVVWGFQRSIVFCARYNASYDFSGSDNMLIPKMPFSILPNLGSR